MLLEGRCVASFFPGRGIRQGDPLSPYLFILVADDPSNLVNNACDLGNLRRVKMARRCPVLSHFFFADDALFFLRATEDNCDELRRILNLHCCAFWAGCQFREIWFVLFCQC